LPIRVCHNRRIHSHPAVTPTPGQVDDRRPVGKLVRRLRGKLFTDRGYISQPLFEQLWAKGLQLITKLKRNMKNKLMPLWDKLLPRRRVLIECVNDQLKNISQIEHTRHRSAVNGVVSIIPAVVAYTFQPKKPGFERFTLSATQNHRLLMSAMAS
jgi:hypothetical protein